MPTFTGSESDIYRLPVGLRLVTWDSNNFYINYQPFYFRGFGRHEDSNLRKVQPDRLVVSV